MEAEGDLREVSACIDLCLLDSAVLCLRQTWCSHQFHHARSIHSSFPQLGALRNLLTCVSKTLQVISVVANSRHLALTFALALIS